MINLLLLADVNSPHTIKWAANLARNNFKVTIFTLSKIESNAFQNYESIKVISFGFNTSTFLSNSGSFRKLKYLKVVSELKKIIKNLKPDILHAHFASSYGLLGALTGFPNYVISLWGQDIMLFPNHSIFHKKILQFNLSKAKIITATSRLMVVELSKYSDKKAILIPFGIDTEIFNESLVKNPFGNSFVIGTIKNLEKKYGIDLLLKSFKIVKDNFPQKDLKLVIVGKGSKENQLKKLCMKLGIIDNTIFYGFVDPKEIASMHNLMDIEVYLSRAESFGVSIIEASSCKKPVVVSNVGGLPETVINNETGFIVDDGDYLSAANRIIQLIESPELRKQMGENGREFVKSNYRFDVNLQQMITVYKSLV